MILLKTIDMARDGDYLVATVTTTTCCRKDRCIK